jgi:hypothetical protein
VVIGYAAPDAVQAFRGRAAGRGDVRERALAPFTAPFNKIDEAGLIGYGIGAAHQGAAAVVKYTLPYSWLHGNLVETESGKVMIELGPLGFALVYFARFYLVVFALNQAFRLRTRFHRALATAAFLLFLAQIPGSVIFDPTMDVYYWFFGGLLMTAMNLDYKAVRAAAPAAVAAVARQVRPGVLPLPTPAASGRQPAW